MADISPQWHEQLLSAKPLANFRANLLRQGFLESIRKPARKDLPRTRNLEWHDFKLQLMKAPVRFEWGYSQFAREWYLSCAASGRSREGRTASGDAREWRALLNDEVRDRGENSLQWQVEFFLENLPRIQALVLEDHELATRLMDARIRLNSNWPTELHNLVEALKLKGYAETSRLGPDQAFGNLLVDLVGPVLGFRFEKDRGIWAVLAGRAHIGAFCHQAEVWRAWKEGRTPNWHDFGLGFHSYVADASFFLENHDELAAAVAEPQPVVGILEHYKSAAGITSRHGAIE